MDGALVVIAGKPNVGKSTLLNTLTKTDRAITSPKPGTTRDSIDVSLLLDGVPVRFFDTAGIRRGAADVEREGIRRTKKLTQKADIVLSLYEYNKNSTYKQKSAYAQPSIHIINKADLIKPNELQKLKLLFPGFMFVSAKKRTGIGDLKNTIKKTLGVSPSLSSATPLTTTRQQVALEDVFGCLTTGTGLLQDKNCSYELLSFELSSALDSINSLLGITTPDEIINNVFKSFCVGK
jgi:tRNA modification GTPase